MNVYIRTSLQVTPFTCISYNIFFLMLIALTFLLSITKFTHASLLCVCNNMISIRIA